MQRVDAIKKIVENLTDQLVISNIGVPSKELYKHADRPENFYMLGSMGMATCIGFGLALALEEKDDDRKVIVIEGDGAMLMNLGELVTIHAQKPKNLLIALIDNESYGSTGSQKTYTDLVNLSDVAKGVGFKEVITVDCRKSFDNLKMNEILSKTGPVFLHIKVEPGNSKAGVINLSPTTIKDRFMDVVR